MTGSGDQSGLSGATVPGSGTGPAGTGQGAGTSQGVSGGAAQAAGTTGGAAQAAGTTGGAAQGTGGVAPGAAQPGGPAQSRGPATGSLIKFGNVGNYSGLLGGIFGVGGQTTKVWEASVNSRGGLTGHRVNVHVLDDGGNPSRNLTLTRNLVENEHVIAFVGDQAPLSAMGSTPYRTERRIPTIGEGVDPSTQVSPMFFTGTGFFPNTAVMMGKIASQQNANKIAIFYVTETPIAKQVTDILSDPKNQALAGVQVVQVSKVSIAQPSFSGECAQAKGKGARAFMAMSESNTLYRMIRDCKAQGLGDAVYVGHGFGATQNAPENPSFDGVYFPSATFPAAATDTPAAREYQAAMKQYRKDLIPVGPSAQAWTEGKVVELAVSLAPLGPNPTSADILRGLWKIKNSNVFGLGPPGITFTEGQIPAHPRCAFIAQIKGGKWTAPQQSRPVCW